MVNKTVSSKSKLLIREPWEGYVTIKIPEIIYIESRERKRWIYTVKKEFITYRNLSDLYIELPKPYFYQPHKSFAINMNYILKWKETEIYMRNGAVIPLSHRRKAEFRRIYMEFMQAFRS